MPTTTQTLSYHEIVSHLPANTVVIFHDVGWEEYEELLKQIGEAHGQRISYADGILQVMTLSPEHEKYAEFIKRLVSHLGFRLQIDILFFGSMTMKRQGSKGTEPDACFYVQSARLIGNRMQLDFASDPPPDIAVEIDVHHESISKFSIYAALAVPEIWHYDGRQLTMHHLDQDAYITSETSRALPVLTSRVLTRFLGQVREEGEFRTLSAFDEWLQTQVGDGGQGPGVRG